MLALLLCTAALAAPLPDVALAWKKGAGLLTVVAPAGEHVAEDAPVRGFVEQGEARTEWAVPGAALVEGLRLSVGEGALSGQLRVSLCEDGGSLCRWAEVQFASQLAGRRGTVVIDGRAPPVAPAPPRPPDPASTYVGDPDAAVLDAQARARATGGRLVLDFGAVWCPPCNLMSAEVLHDPQDPEALAGLVLVAIDADRPDSWTLKDRYAVGGYPTLVATDPDGREVARLVGYPGEAALLAWLDEVRGGLDLGGGVPEQPAAAVAVAYAHARQGQAEQARAALQVALRDPALLDRAELRRARFLVEPGPEDLRWLLAHDLGAIGPVLEWVWPALGLATEEPALADALRTGLARVLPLATPAQAADLLWALGRLEPEGPRRQALSGAGAAALAGALSGDLHRDRGHLVFHADLLAEAGDLDAALAVLAPAIAAWPEEFTFHYAAAGLLLDGERAAAAEAPARAALAHAYGDNRLRAGRRLAEVLAALDRRPEALEVIAEALDRAERPGEDLDVRTPRYVRALEELRDELAR